MPTMQPAPIHSGYPLGAVHPARRAGRRAPWGSRVRRGVAVAGSASLITGAALVLSA